VGSPDGSISKRLFEFKPKPACLPYNMPESAASAAFAIGIWPKLAGFPAKSSARTTRRPPEHWQPHSVIAAKFR
jgi:hypothetical protein